MELQDSLGGPDQENSLQKLQSETDILSATGKATCRLHILYYNFLLNKISKKALRGVHTRERKKSFKPTDDTS